MIAKPAKHVLTVVYGVGRCKKPFNVRSDLG